MSFTTKIFLAPQVVGIKFCKKAGEIQLSCKRKCSSRHSRNSKAKLVHFKVLHSKIRFSLNLLVEIRNKRKLKIYLIFQRL